MSCAPKSGLDVSGAFGASSDQSDILSKPLCSFVYTAFFLFWVKLWVKGYRAAQNLIRRIQRRSTKAKNCYCGTKTSNVLGKLLNISFLCSYLNSNGLDCQGTFGGLSSSPARPFAAPVSPLYSILYRVAGRKSIGAVETSLCQLYSPGFVRCWEAVCPPLGSVRLYAVCTRRGKPRPSCP